MKSTRKHELQTNELADAIGRLVETARPHARIIAFACVAVLLLIVILVVIPAVRGGGGDTATVAFNLALTSEDAQPLRDFLKQHSSGPQVHAARLLLAERILGEVVRGSAAPPGSDAQARNASLLAEAADLYDQVAEASPTLAPLAHVGRALISIQQGELDKGRAALQEVMDKHPQSIAAEKAKAHIEALAGYAPVPFSDEPLEEEKKPDAAGEPKPPEAVPSGAAKPAAAPSTESTSPAETPKAAPKPDASPEAPKG